MMEGYLPDLRKAFILFDPLIPKLAIGLKTSKTINHTHFYVIKNLLYTCVMPNSTKRMGEFQCHQQGACLFLHICIFKDNSSTPSGMSFSSLLIANSSQLIFLEVVLASITAFFTLPNLWDIDIQNLHYYYIWVC